jgi:hypothetical protein
LFQGFGSGFRSRGGTFERHHDPFKVFEDAFRNDDGDDFHGMLGSHFRNMNRIFEEDPFFSNPFYNGSRNNHDNRAGNASASTSYAVASRALNNNLAQFRFGDSGGGVSRSVSTSTTIRNGRKHTVRMVTIRNPDGTEESTVEEHFE